MTEATQDILGVRGLEVAYGPFTVLNGVDLTVRRGEALVLIGANGAGKSTVLKAVAGFVRPSGGTVTLEGSDVTGRRPHQLLASGCAYVAQGQDLFPRMTVRQNVVMGAYQIRDRARVSERLDFVESLFPVLRDKQAAYAEGLSGGERQQLKIARALMTEPRLLLLDEPTAGLSPKLVETAFQDLHHIREQTGTTILLVEQNIRKGLEVADRGCVLELGSVTHDLPADELVRSSVIHDLFLGQSEQQHSTSVGEADSADQ
jgi:branched-chain amino acid transport system ATP-binding protein